MLFKCLLVGFRSHSATDFGKCVCLTALKKKKNDHENVPAPWPLSVACIGFVGQGREKHGHGIEALKRQGLCEGQHGDGGRCRRASL